MDIKAEIGRDLRAILYENWMRGYNNEPLSDAEMKIYELVAKYEAEIRKDEREKMVKRVESLSKEAQEAYENTKA